MLKGWQDGTKMQTRLRGFVGAEQEGRVISPFAVSKIAERAAQEGDADPMLGKVIFGTAAVAVGILALLGFGLFGA